MIKLYLVVPTSSMALKGWLVGASCELRREELGWVVSLEALFFLVDFCSGSCSTFFDLAMGKDNPRSFPLLATPTFQVRAVLYPEQSLP